MDTPNLAPLDMPPGFTCRNVTPKGYPSFTKVLRPHTPQSRKQAWKKVVIRVEISFVWDSWRWKALLVYDAGVHVEDQGFPTAAAAAVAFTLKEQDVVTALLREA